jgi:hypothetical protein
MDLGTYPPVNYMHQVDLGIMKRLLLYWVDGERQVKLSASQKLSVNIRLKTFRLIILAKSHECAVNLPPGKPLNVGHFCIKWFICFARNLFR